MLTGNIRYRKNFYGALVVQVEYKYYWSPSSYNYNDEEVMLKWRHATPDDLEKLNSITPIA